MAEWKSERKHVLVICARNKIRSLTAEKIYRSDMRIEVRSAGLSKVSRCRVNQKHIDWAELILVMEHSHKSRLKQMVGQISCPVVVLGIEDIYEPMEPDLVEILRDRVETALEQAGIDG